MKLTTLIPMTDFVNQIGNMENYPGHDKALSWIYNYATFLKQPLKLEMFVPCDDEGNVLEYKPNEDMHKDAGSFMAYNKAKEKVLFEIEKYEIGILNGGKAIWINNFAGQIIDDFKFLTIEDLVSKSFQLTPTAIKQIQP